MVTLVFFYCISYFAACHFASPFLGLPAPRTGMDTQRLPVDRSVTMQKGNEVSAEFLL